MELSPPGFPGLADLVTPDAYVVLVSQGAPTDEAALRRVVGRESAYIGMMGSRRKVRAVFAALAAEGVSDADLARGHAPIGLEIAADTPVEIAIAILAQLIGVRADRSKAVVK